MRKKPAAIFSQKEFETFLEVKIIKFPKNLHYYNFKLLLIFNYPKNEVLLAVV